MDRICVASAEVANRQRKQKSQRHGPRRERVAQTIGLGGVGRRTCVVGPPGVRERQKIQPH